MFRVSCWYVGIVQPGYHQSEKMRTRCDIGDFSDRKTAEIALANAAKSPDFRGGEIREIE
jgi:hypothetical protein